MRATPPIYRGVDRAGAEIGDASPATAQVVEMDVDLRRSADRDIDRLLLDDVSGDDVAGKRLAAVAGMYDDPGRARRSRIRNIRAIACNVVAGDQISGELCACLMGVHRDPRLPVADQPVADYHVVKGRCLHRLEGARTRRGEKPDASAVSGDEESVLRDLVGGDRVAEDAVGHGRIRAVAQLRRRL